MSVCPNCNTNNQEGAAFCGMCGAKLASQATYAQTHTPAPATNPMSNAQSNYVSNQTTNYAQGYVQNHSSNYSQQYEPNQQAYYSQGYSSEPVMQASTMNQQPVSMQGQKRLHCPNCKSVNITITTESSVTGAVSTGRNIRTTHVSNYHRNFWVCSDCGTKFRNIQSLEDEIHKCRNYPKVYFVLACLSALLFIALFINVKNDPFAGFFLSVYVYLSLIAAIVFLILGFWCQNKLKNMREEASYLQQNCFD